MQIIIKLLLKLSNLFENENMKKRIKIKVFQIVITMV